jgi:hypothetical protein
MGASMPAGKFRLSDEERQGLTQVATASKPIIAAQLIARLFLLGLIEIVDGKPALTVLGVGALLGKLKQKRAALPVA